MTLDGSMTSSAQAWAQRIAGMGKLEHSKSGSPDNPDKDGENIAYMCLMPGEEYPGQRPVKMWWVLFLNFPFVVVKCNKKYIHVFSSLEMVKEMVYIEVPKHFYVTGLL